VKNPAELTLTEIAGALRRRTFSSTELTRWMLERIGRWQPIINAFVRIDEDEALAAAKRADRALGRGKAKGALHGVPLAHKDMYYVKGKVSECGSKVRKGWIAPATATVLTRLSAAGSFPIGALHMSEFAYSPTGHNSYLGPACNAWDAKCITGGSSSGSGTAVAARLIPAALGSDTGGSIRLPAHFCGVTGFKPTYGRVSRANALPLSFTLDTVGPLSVSAEDAGAVMGIIAGPDPLDATTLGAPSWNAKATRVSPKGLRIAVPARFYVDDLEPDIASALDATIVTLRKLGAKIAKVELPDQTVLSAAALIVLAIEATSAHAPWLRTRAADYGPQVRNRLHNGLAYSAVEYLEALRWRGPALAAHLDAIGNIDVILAPVSRSVAPTIAATDLGGMPEAEAAIQAITRFMRPVNFLGLPSLVVPVGQSKSGLPIGMQLIGRPFGDETLIALGRAFQAASDHHRRMPALP
jgi:aspartyl-tRNA(Asn)/glutamyl-tRNA(Gln) amidotransferase subunit A